MPFSLGHLRSRVTSVQKTSAVQLIRGSEEILALSPVLSEFASRCDQAGAVADLAYFLFKPGLLKRVPVLLLFPRTGMSLPQPVTAETLGGAVLLYEYQLAGVSTNLFTSNDRSGRSTLLAPAAERPLLASVAARHLLKTGAHLVLISFRSPKGVAEEAEQVLSHDAPRSWWATRDREIPEFLPLKATYDETLAAIGQRTRSNLRYYRRRAEKDLGCVFVPQAEITTKELLEFSKQCMYAVSDTVAAWRHRALSELSDPILMGMKDRDGRWLSLVGGRRVEGNSEILWQLNREGLPFYSLSLIMRGYLMEHEIARGATRFYIEGATPHPIRHSFTVGTVTDLAVLRRSVPAVLTQKAARHLLDEENELGQILFDTEVRWKASDQPGTETRTPAEPGHSPSSNPFGRPGLL